MVGMGRHRYFKALTAALLVLALLLAVPGAAAADASGPVTFTVRRGPLRVRLLLPDLPVRGEPTRVRAVVKNVGTRRLKAVAVQLQVRPRSVYSRTIKRVNVLPAGSRQAFAWRVRFPKARIYILTATATARRKGSAMHIAGAKKRIKVRRRPNALGLFAFLAKTLASL